jgi:hypothetical protein
VTASSSPRSLSVRGGTTGIAADCAQIRDLARAFGAAARDDLGQLGQLHLYLGLPAVLASAALDPPGAAAFEAELLLALDGPMGLAACAASAGAADAELKSAAAGYEAAQTALDPVVSQLKAGLKAPRAMWHARGAIASGNIGGVFGALLTYDPELADSLSAGARNALFLGAEAAFIDGRPRVLAIGEDESPYATRVPSNLADVMRGTALRDEDRDGAIDVRIITNADGSRAVIVDITGTKSQLPLPLNHDIADYGSGAAAIQGHATAYEQGVLDALDQAGVSSSDPVMLVGHSLGGMVAVNLAHDAVRSERLNVTHVVTAGAPVGLTVGALPPTVNVLALENSRDMVPHLDGASNPDRVNVTTVGGDYGDHFVGGAHSLAKSYVPMAEDVDASDDPAVRDYLASASGFLSGTSVVTHTYVIQRKISPADVVADDAPLRIR